MDIKKRSRFLVSAKDKPYRVIFNRHEVPVIETIAREKYFIPFDVYEDVARWDARRDRSQILRVGNFAMIASDLKTFHDRTPATLQSILEDMGDPRLASYHLSRRHALGERAIGMFFQINEYIVEKEASEFDSKLEILLASHTNETKSS